MSATIEVCKVQSYIAVDDLKFYPQNPRTIKPERLAELKRSIRSKGFYQPILVWKKNGIVLAGNHRLLAAKELINEGFTFKTQDGKHKNVLPVVIEDVSEEVAKAILFESNNTYAEWIEDKLRQALEDAESSGFDLSAFGFTQEYVDSILKGAEKDAEALLNGSNSELDESEKFDPLTDEDAIPEDDAPIVIKRGDTWILGKHRLHCGDSTNKDDVSILMAGEKADMLFTDPPYGVSYEGGHNDKKRKQIANDSLAGDDLTSLFHKSLQCATKFTADHAAFYVWFASGKSVETFAAFAKLPLKLRAVIQWYKVRSGLGAFMSQYIPNCEPCIYAHKTGKSPQWFGPTDEKTVWELKKEARNEYHPTQKPVELSERAILNSSKKDQVILDLFGGSGATLIACEKTGRRCYMMELDEKYVQTIIKRWQDFTGKEAIHAETGDTFNSLQSF